ncbi:MAG: hypothetical protein HYX54_00085 [Chloroflexi bacterium]|nr:hypothetical protein [Chloroflexota bacterium]
MQTAPAAARPENLKPMPYGKVNVRSIRDGIWEPLWGGRRVLIEVLGHEVRIRDEGGEQIKGYEALRVAMADAALAEDLVLDGYLLPAPLRETTGAEAGIGLDSVPSAGQMSRQMLIGAGSYARREAIEESKSRDAAPSPSSPAAFVAVDLLWLDGDSLIDVPLGERKRLLDGVFQEGDLVRRTVTVRPPVEAWYSQWRALGFREVAVKGVNSRYTPGKPSGEWATMMIPRR